MGTEPEPKEEMSRFPYEFAIVMGAILEGRNVPISVAIEDLKEKLQHSKEETQTSETQSQE